MASMAKTVLQSIFKVVNSVMGIVGVAMVLYGFWMVRVWQRDLEPDHDYHSTAPWFICTFFGIGITFCVIACLGHISAASSNGFCLSCYTVIIWVLLLLETAAAADVLLNSDWKKDLPEDPTQRFHDFREFVKSNKGVFKLMGLLIFLAQGCCILLAMAIRALGQNNGNNYEFSDEECCPPRLPLINHNSQLPSYVVGGPHFIANADPWLTSK